MTSVGDWLTRDAQEEYVDSRLGSGRVLRLQCEFTNLPKIKFLVLVCWNEEPLLLVINSEVSRYYQKHSLLHSCQVLLQASEYHFLNHDSYVDCTKVVAGQVMREIRRLCLDDIGSIKGELNPDTKEKIRRAVRRAVGISEYHKKAIESALV